MPFFNGLEDRLRKEGVQTRVFASAPTSTSAARGDAAEAASWQENIPSRTLNVAGRQVTFQKVPRDFYEADGVIVGLVGTLPQMYSALLRKNIALRPRLGLWGHVRSYVGRSSFIDVALEKYVAKRADHVFAYTRAGEALALQWGVAEGRVTAVMNSVDTSSLIAALGHYRAQSTVRLAGIEWSRDSPVLSYIGGVDESKRIRFLTQSLDEIWRIDPSVRVIVAGRGAEESLLAPSISRGQVVHIGYADDDVLGKIGAISSAILMPGRIGLVAVHALAMGVPIISTPWPYHAPEQEYLVGGESLFVAADDARSFALEALAALQRTPGRRPWPYPTMTEMVGNYAGGVRKMLGRW
ncbi:glycosyltransferase [Microbacterium ureisolvens]|uniref:glycosyltransferase n=1 Tax=Microbacterium ureisolvens TaxID=2781186 RepID=UPI00363A146E